MWLWDFENIVKKSKGIQVTNGVFSCHDSEEYVPVVRRYYRTKQEAIDTYDRYYNRQFGELIPSSLSTTSARRYYTRDQLTPMKYSHPKYSFEVVRIVIHYDEHSS